MYRSTGGGSMLSLERPCPQWRKLQRWWSWGTRFANPKFRVILMKLPWARFQKSKRTCFNCCFLHRRWASLVEILDNFPSLLLCLGDLLHKIEPGWAALLPNAFVPLAIVAPALPTWVSPTFQIEPKSVVTKDRLTEKNINKKNYDLLEFAQCKFLSLLQFGI